MESPGSARSTLSSPEAEVGMRVEDLWDIQEPQLSPSQKLNSCFESLPVSSFPIASPHLVDIPSDATLADAVQILSKNNILSAPVRNVDAPEDASWIDKYIGVVEFAGIAVWLLHQSELATRDENSNDSKVGVGGLTNKLSAIKVNGTKEGSPAASVDGTFLQNLTSSDLYKSTKVRDISGSFRWAPFLALQSSDSFLTMLLLLSKYRMKSLPVVDLGEGKIDNIITQSAVVHMLEECVGLHWFEDWGTKKLFELGLPIHNKLVKVRDDESVLKAFQLMRKRRVGALPVVDKTRKKAIGNISLRDVQYLLTYPEIFKDYRSITTKDFITTVRNHIKEEEKDSYGSLEVVSCKRDDTIKDVIIKLDAEKIQRVYVVDKDGNLEGVVTLRDIISRLVHEPNGYFGDFFDGVVPLPENSTSKKHLLEMTNPFLELRSATIHHAQIHICSVDCVKYLTGNGVENLFTLHVQWAAQILRVIDPQKRGDIQS